MKLYCIEYKSAVPHRFQVAVCNEPDPQDPLQSAQCFLSEELFIISKPHWFSFSLLSFICLTVFRENLSVPRSFYFACLDCSPSNSLPRILEPFVHVLSSECLFLLNWTGCVFGKKFKRSVSKSRCTCSVTRICRSKSVTWQIQIPLIFLYFTAVIELSDGLWIMESELS